MPSNTKQTEEIRRKKRDDGNKRKRIDRNKGTTPKFAIHEKIGNCSTSAIFDRSCVVPLCVVDRPRLARPSFSQPNLA